MPHPKVVTNAAVVADITAIIGKIKTGGSSREASCAVTKLEEAQHWLHADIATMEATENPLGTPQTAEQLAEAAYKRFHAAGGYEQLDWKHQAPKEKAQWIAAISPQVPVRAPVPSAPPVTVTPEPTVTEVPEEDE